MKLCNAALPACLLSLSLAPLHAAADPWDGYDELPGQALHDLAHGSDETHDLAARPLRIGTDADVDWWIVPQEPYSSYEVSIDGISGPAGDVELTRWDAAGALTKQNAVPLSAAGGWSRTLRWIHDASAPAVDSVRVGGASCALKCTPDARYRIRAVDTTLSIARFSNTGNQVTVLNIKNLRSTNQQVTAYFWNASGSLLGSVSQPISARGSLLLNLTTLPSTVGSSGSITVAHDAGHSGLDGYSLVLEPATGMSFVYQATMKPR